VDFPGYIRARRYREREEMPYLADFPEELGLGVHQVKA